MVDSEHPDDDAAHRTAHDRRYRIFAAVFALVVLSFAAISIAVVAHTP
jgi:hypothetical protein